MLVCPNINLKSWKDLVEVQGENNAYLIWDKYEGKVPKVFREVPINSLDVKNIAPINTAAFKSIQLQNTNSRNLEIKLNLRDSTGKPKLFTTQADAAKFYREQLDKLEKSDPALYNVVNGRFNYRPSKVLSKQKRGGYVQSVEKYRGSLIPNLTKAIDGTYGKFSLEENRKVVDTLFSDREGLTTDTVSQAILDNGFVSDDTAVILEFLTDIQLPVEFVAMDGNALMQTDGSVVRINTNLLVEAHPRLIAEAFVHELIHTQLVTAIETPRNASEQLLSRRVSYLYNLLKQYDNENRYGFTDESEFVAELMSNSEFRGYVKKLENGNIWQKIINALADFFGISRGSTKLIKDLSKVLQASTEVNTFKIKNKEITPAARKVLNTMITSVSTRLKALQFRLGEDTTGAKKEGIAEQERLLSILTKAHRDGTDLNGITEYFKNVQDLSSNFEDIVAKQRLSLMTTKDNDYILKQAGTIKSMGNFAYSQLNIIDTLVDNLRDIRKENPELSDVVEEALAISTEVRTRFQLLKSDFIDLSKIIVGKFLLPFSMGASLTHIEKVLSEPTVDLSGKNKWLDNMQESGDEFLALIDVALKNYYNDANKETLEFEKDILELKQKLEDAGIKSMDFMIKDGSHYFLTEHDIAGFYKKRDEFAKTLPDPEGNIIIERSNANKWIKFYSKNTVSKIHSPDKYFALMAEKSAELGDKFDLWKELNTIRNPRTGDEVIPINVDPAYTKMMSNPLKAEAYYTVLQQKQNLERTFPKNKKHLRRLPQIRKDFIERVKAGDYNRMFQEVKEGLQIKEDDTEYGEDYGLKDEAGNIVRFIPIYFINKLNNVQDLSTDVASSMIAYAYSSIKRDKLSLIVDVLELGKEVMKERGVLQTSNRGKIIKSIKKFAGVRIEENQKEVGPGNVYDRLERYLNMFVYGELKKKGTIIPILNIDSEKAVDALGRYTGLRTLAGNTYAMLANAGVGETLAALESVHKKFFDGNSYRNGQKLYHKHLPAFIGNIGKRMDDSKLGLWSEYMDAMNNFDERIYSINAERKTRLGQLANTSALFFTSKIPEHKLHNTISLTVASEFKYDPKKGRFVFRNEFYREHTEALDSTAIKLKALRAEEAKELSELKKDERNSRRKEIALKYKQKADKILSLRDKTPSQKLTQKEAKKKLDAQWDSMTNYWDAHEVKNNRLTLKSEYQNADSNTDRNRFINRQHSVNDSIQGMYSKLNKNALQYTSWGRLGMMYRKWLIPSFNRRFAKKHRNFEKEMDVEGYYRSSGRLAVELFKDLRMGTFSVIKSWNTLTAEEKANVQRTLLDVSVYISLSLLGTALLNLKGDDDDDWGYNMLAYEVNRIKTELGALTPPFAAGELFKILQSPLAVTNTVSQLYYMGSSLNWFEDIERGKYEGMKIYQRNLIRTIPLLETGYSLGYPEDKLKYFAK